MKIAALLTLISRMNLQKMFLIPMFDLEIEVKDVEDLDEIWPANVACQRAKVSAIHNSLPDGRMRGRTNVHTNCAHAHCSVKMKVHEQRSSRSLTFFYSSNSILSTYPGASKSIFLRPFCL